MNRFLLLALTAGLLSSTPASALLGEKKGTKVWSSHQILNNSNHDIYRKYDSFTEKATCSREPLFFGRSPFLYLYEDGEIVVDLKNEVEIKLGNKKPIVLIRPTLNPVKYLKYKTVKLRYIRDGRYVVTHSLNTSEIKKHLKSYKACVRSTTK